MSEKKICPMYWKEHGICDMWGTPCDGFDKEYKECETYQKHKHLLKKKEED